VTSTDTKDNSNRSGLNIPKASNSQTKCETNFYGKITRGYTK